MFYSGLKKELQPIKPFSKFLSVKAIVFFSWWQGFFIQTAVSTGYITHTAFYTKDNVARALQNWLVCIEMLLFAICKIKFLNLCPIVFLLLNLYRVL